MINYQGRLTEIDGEPENGEFNIVISIYDQIDDGNLLWGEDHITVHGTGVADSDLVTKNYIDDNVLTGNFMNNALFEGGTRVSSHLSINNFRNKLDINKAYVKPRDNHYATFGDTVSLPLLGLEGSGWEDTTSGHLHPDVVYFPEGWPRGDNTVLPWKYWMVTTPLRPDMGDTIENPYIWVSNDGLDWGYQLGALAGDTVTNPLYTFSQFDLTDRVYWYADTVGGDTVVQYYDTANADTIGSSAALSCAHLSDPAIFIAEDGELYLAILASYPTDSIQYGPGDDWFLNEEAEGAVWIASTDDGLDWSSPTRITNLAPALVSPAIIMDTSGSLQMFVNLSDTDQVAHRSFGIWRYSNPGDAGIVDSGLWSFNYTEIIFDNEPTDNSQWDIPLTSGGYNFGWHFDIIARGVDELIMLFLYHKSAVGDVSKMGMASSYNHGASFTVADRPFMAHGWKLQDDTSGVPADWHRSDGHLDSMLYKSTGIWMDDGLGGKMELWYSAFTKYSAGGQYWNTFRTEVIFTAKPTVVEFKQVYGKIPATDSAYTTFVRDSTVSTLQTYMLRDTFIVVGNNDVDTILMVATFDCGFQSDSLIIYYKGAGDAGDTSQIDKINIYAPADSNNYWGIADSLVWSFITNTMDEVTLTKTVIQFDWVFESGEEAKIMFIDSLFGQTLDIHKVQMKGRSFVE